MKRMGLLLAGLCSGLSLTACGSLSTTPAPVTGDLLGAPTTLNMGGRMLKAEAKPILNGNKFSVRVRIHADRPPLPNLRLTGVFVVTSAGVWKSPLSAKAQLGCGEKLCTQGTASSSASGFQPGESVQVIARLSDQQGRTLWLRDAQVRVLRGSN